MTTARFMASSLLLGTVLCVSAGMPARGQCEIQKLLASDGHAGQVFGFRVAASGDGSIIVVGAPRDDERGADAGAAYILRFDELAGEWVEEVKLLGGFTGQGFGGGLGMHGSRVLIGAPIFDGLSWGSVQVFEYSQQTSQWERIQTFNASDRESEDLFGSAMDLSGDRLIIGASSHGDAAGAAYIFEWDGAEWVEQQKVAGLDIGAGDRFGTSVAIDGDLAVVGAPEQDGQVVDAGALYFFRFDGQSWSQEQKVTLEDPLEYDHLGRHVRVGPGGVAAGRAVDPTNGDESGAVLIFRLDDEWRHVETLRPLDGDADDRFGYWIAMDNELLAVSAFQDEGPSFEEAGSVYLFRFIQEAEGWYERTKLTASDADEYDHLGLTTALAGDLLVAGAMHDDQLGLNSGSAYVFRPEQCTLNAVATSYSVTEGTFNGGLLRDTYGSDDEYLRLQQRAAVTPILPVIGVEFESQISIDGPLELKVAIETASNALPDPPSQLTSLFNYDSNAWEPVDFRQTTSSDSTIELSFGTNPGRFIDDVSGSMAMRLEWFDPGRVIFPAWGVRLDRVMWTVEP